VSIERLLDGFAKHRRAGGIFGDLPLRDIARLADAVAFEREGDVRLHAFTLSRILYDIAEQQEDRPVQSDESEEIWRILSQPTIRCVDFIAGKETDGASILSDILDKYFEVRALIG
jgi:hypothetical protein